MKTVKQSTKIKHYAMISHLLICLSAIFTLFLVKSAQAVTINAHEKIENEIHNYIKAQLIKSPQRKTEIIISPIDRRKRLSQCIQPLIINLTGKNGIKRNNTVSVICPSVWRIFVPVSVKTLMPIVTARNNLAVGEIISHDNIAIEYLDTSLIIGPTHSEMNNILGAKVKRYIQGGKAILANLICMVCKNEQVSIIARKGTLQIKSAGKALSDGSKGQKISIKNNSSGRIIEATVVAVGRAEINL